MSIRSRDAERGGGSEEDRAAKENSEERGRGQPIRYSAGPGRRVEPLVRAPARGSGGDRREAA